MSGLQVQGISMMQDRTTIRWDDGLTGASKRIAENTQFPFRVLAGPGTGKTFSLMRHVARLVQEENVDPTRILVATFTRTAAGDLRRSLHNLRVENAQRVRAATL